MRVVPLLSPAQPDLAGPPAPEGAPPSANAGPASDSAANKIEINTAPAATEPAMVPETPEDDHAAGNSAGK